jgi:hypothetical protein
MNETKLDEALRNRDDYKFDMVYVISEDDHGKLSISCRSYAKLTAAFGMPFGAVFAFSRNSTETGSGFRHLSSSSLSEEKEGRGEGMLKGSWDYWCLLPTRAATSCKRKRYDHDDDNEDDASMHGEYSASKGVHLAKQKVDVEQASFGVYVRYDSDKKKSEVVVIHRERKLDVGTLKNAGRRVEQVLKTKDGDEVWEGPLFVVLIYLARALRMWGSCLWEVNRQVIQYVSFPVSSFTSFSLRNRPIMALGNP